MPWHADDLNARLKKNAAFPLFRRAVGVECEPVWPEKWPRAALLERKAEIGSASFARGYRLLPVSEEDTPIRREWVRVWTEPAEYDTVVLSVDPAVSVSAKADASALVVLGRTVKCPLTLGTSCRDLSPRGEVLPGLHLSPGGEVAERSEAGEGVLAATQVHVLAAAARRVAAPDLVALIDAFDRQWNPAVILFEDNAAFKGIRDLLARHARFGPKLKGVSQGASKEARVAAFSVAVENGGFRLRGDAGGIDVSQQELFEEMTTFPFGEHDDLLDAAATGCAFLLDRRDPRVW